jgi:hypothetical protein
MSNYLWFWLSKAIVEFGIALGILTLGSLFLLALWIPTWRKQSKCQHPRVHETQSCDAICLECGKNLGFIGAWREKHQCELH